MNEIENGEIKLADVKNNQEMFKPNLSEIRKESKTTATKNQKSKKTQYKILKCFTNQETRLLNFLMILL